MKRNTSVPTFNIVAAVLAGVLPICLSAGCLFVGCGLNLNEFKHQEERLKPLVQKRAAKEELISLLGSNFLMYTKDGTNWVHLTNFLIKETPYRLVAVRERVARWPHAMLYSTPEMMTWVFLDKDEKVADYVVGAQ